jgi:hypothetical protein
VCVCVFVVCVFLRVCVCVCVCERERERERSDLKLGDVGKFRFDQLNSQNSSTNLIDNPIN